MLTHARHKLFELFFQKLSKTIAITTEIIAITTPNSIYVFIATNDTNFPYVFFFSYLKISYWTTEYKKLTTILQFERVRLCLRVLVLHQCMEKHEVIWNHLVTAYIRLNRTRRGYTSEQHWRPVLITSHTYFIRFHTMCSYLASTYQTYWIKINNEPNNSYLIYSIKKKKEKKKRTNTCDGKNQVSNVTSVTKFENKLRISFVLWRNQREMTKGLRARARGD